MTSPSSVSPPRSRSKFAWVAMAVLSVCAIPSLSAQEPEIPGAPHLFPEDTFAYIRIDNVDDIRESASSSSMGRMMADPKMKPFASEFWLTLSELFGEISDRVGVSLDELVSIPSGQVAVALIPGNPPEESAVEDEDEDDESTEAIRRRIARKRRQQNSLAGLFMVDAGKNVDDLLAIVSKLEGQLREDGYVRRTSKVEKTELIRWIPPRPGRPEIEYFEKDNTVVLGIGHSAAADALDHWLDRSELPTLADSANFAAVMSRCVGAESTRPQVTFYGDPYHLVERLIKRGGAAAFVWPIAEELGVAKIRGLGGSIFRGSEIFEDISHFHMLIDPPRDGFFGVIRPETGDSTPPKWVSLRRDPVHVDLLGLRTNVRQLGQDLGKISGT